MHIIVKQFKFNIKLILTLTYEYKTSVIALDDAYSINILNIVNDIDNNMMHIIRYYLVTSYKNF